MISILIPTYKRPAKLQLLLNSIYYSYKSSETDEELEIVLCDNNPNHYIYVHECVRVIKKYVMESTHRITFKIIRLEKPDYSEIAFRYHLIQAASNDWCWFIDDDAIINHIELSKLFRALPNFTKFGYNLLLEKNTLVYPDATYIGIVAQIYDIIFRKSSIDLTEYYDGFVKPDPYSHRVGGDKILLGTLIDQFTSLVPIKFGPLYNMYEEDGDNITNTMSTDDGYEDLVDNNKFFIKNLKETFKG